MQGCKERVFSQDYIAWLLAAACDHLWTPLPGEAQDRIGIDGHRGSDGIAPQPARQPSQEALLPVGPVLPEPQLCLPTPCVTVDESHAEGSVQHTQHGHSERLWGTHPPTEQRAINSPAQHARPMSHAASGRHKDQRLVTQPPKEQHAAAAAISAPAQFSESCLAGHGHLEQMLLGREAPPEQQSAAAAKLAPGYLTESSLLAMLMENDDMHLLEPGALCHPCTFQMRHIGPYLATLVSPEAYNCRIYEGTLLTWEGCVLLSWYLCMC